MPLYRTFSTFGKGRLAGSAIIFAAMCGAAAAAADGPGEFAAYTDIGQVELAGAAAFDAGRGAYRVTGSGANIWGSVDAFQFVWKKVVGRPGAFGRGGLARGRQERAPQGGADGAAGSRGRVAICRRGRARRRADLAAVSAGALGPDDGSKSAIKPPASIKLERNGDVFSLSVAPKGEAYGPGGLGDHRPASGGVCRTCGVLS